MTYTVLSIQKILSADLITATLNTSPATIKQLIFDSRQVTFPNISLFFALKGKRQDGHNFVQQAYDKGIRCFVISNRAIISTVTMPLANWLIVENTWDAFQQLAHYHRHQFNLPVIGITGSNGKTIVKEWLFQLLQADFKIVRSPKSYNSQAGVPLSVWQIQNYHTLGLFEAGISKPNEMVRIAPIIDCEIGLFTNLGDAHEENFENRQQKLQEKIQLFTNAHTILYNRDEIEVHQILRQFKHKKLWSWGRHPEADLQIHSKSTKTGHTTLTVSFQHQTTHWSIPFTDEASIQNASLCALCLLVMGYDFVNIQQRLSQLHPVAMRLELKDAKNNCTLINDSYNADLNALGIALNFLQQQHKQPKKTIILSDILQSGLDQNHLYHLVADLVIEKQINRLIGIGNDITALKTYLPNTIEQAFYENTTAFLKQLEPDTFHNETILLKGARPFAFESIANRLAKQIHQTVLEVNLDALQHNLSVYNQYLQADTKIIAMVKASAYGSGSIEVARLLEFHNVDYLAVAYTDEGIELREAGIKLPIIVLNPEEATFDALFNYQLEPEIFSLNQLEAFIQVATNFKDEVSIHLNLDTGMHRLGFEAQHIEALISKLQRTKALKVKSIFSHLAASENPKHDDFTKTQVHRFEQLYQQISHAIGYRPMRHILNSSGILRFPEYQFDMVRLGIGLYGIDSGEEIQTQLQLVNTLKSTISQIKVITPPETIGYGRRGKITAPMRIATIGIGYADGLLRQAGNNGFAVGIHGQLAPIVGSVCMDMTMIDITHIPNASEGDSVVIFGQYPSVQALADCLQTIPYEIFTSVSKRVKRVYIQE